MKPIIRAEGLAKKYVIGASRESYPTLRDALTSAVRSPLRRLRRGAGGEEVWALKDVGFEIGPGEVVGLIGRNGAGKSTLLKMLSRITEPTRGRVELYGRVGSLLEVGTGFHPELSGRENVFLNGAILGMAKAEIERKFDEIVAFAEIEKFIDTPVKRYSSGMYLRLGFAVAAHLEPDILLVDEVLAVGDAALPEEVSQQDGGRGARGAHGALRLAQHARGHAPVPAHHPAQRRARARRRPFARGRGRLPQLGARDDGRARVAGAGVGAGQRGGAAARRACAGRGGRVCDAADIRRPVRLEIEFEVRQPGHLLAPNFHVFNEEGINVFISNDLDPEWRSRPRPVGLYTSTMWVPGNFLAEGTMIVGAALSTLDPVVVHFYERDAVAFQVIDSLDGDSVRGDYAGPYPGVVRPAMRWTTEYAPAGGAGARTEARSA